MSHFLLTGDTVDSFFVVELPPIDRVAVDVAFDCDFVCKLSVALTYHNKYNQTICWNRTVSLFQTHSTIVAKFAFVRVMMARPEDPALCEYTVLRYAAIPSVRYSYLMPSLKTAVMAAWTAFVSGSAFTVYPGWTHAAISALPNAVSVR